MCNQIRGLLVKGPDPPWPEMIPVSKDSSSYRFPLSVDREVKRKSSFTVRPPVYICTRFISHDRVSTLKAEAASCQEPSTVRDPS